MPASLITASAGFPFLLGRAFNEAPKLHTVPARMVIFPFLFGRAFIEATLGSMLCGGRFNFLSFSEGLSTNIAQDDRETVCSVP